LTSGALYIDSITNLHNCNYNNTNNTSKGDKEGDAQSSTVVYYAPRQQRPTTSVAWRPSAGGNSGLVAIGLVGSGYGGGDNSGSMANSSHGLGPWPSFV